MGVVVHVPPTVNGLHMRRVKDVLRFYGVKRWRSGSEVRAASRVTAFYVICQPNKGIRMTLLPHTLFDILNCT